MSKHNILLILVILLIIYAEVIAEEYSIHLDASTESKVDDYKVLDIYGNIYSVEDINGNIDTLLGPYSTEELAHDVLNEIRVIGHSDAYIVKHLTDSIDLSPTTSKQRYESNKVDFKSLLEDSI